MTPSFAQVITQKRAQRERAEVYACVVFLRRLVGFPRGPRPTLGTFCTPDERADSLAWLERYRAEQEAG